MQLENNPQKSYIFLLTEQKSYDNMIKKTCRKIYYFIRYILLPQEFCNSNINLIKKFEIFFQPSN